MFANRQIVTGLVVMLTLSTIGCSESITAPTSFTKHTSSKGTFQCEFPADWENQGGGQGAAREWAKATKGSAVIRISTDIAGSALADMGGAGAFTDSYEESEDLEPVAQVHAFGKLAMEEEYNDYKELSKPEKSNCGFPRSRRSEFTANGTFGGKLHGYRVTALGRDKRIVMICSCSEDDWSTLKPAFDQVIESLQQGGS
jgi:hypothetical protein